MTERLMQFVTGLSRREQQLLVLPLALLQGVALPLLARQDAARAADAEACALRGWIIERQAELALLPAPVAAETPPPVRSPG